MSYFEFYNRLWVIIQEDDGYVKQLFDTAKAQLTEYLETGIADGFSGHTLMWSAQTDFHKEPLKIFEFIDKALQQRMVGLTREVLSATYETTNILCYSFKCRLSNANEFWL